LSYYHHAILPGDLLLIYGDLTAFDMIAFHHLGFIKFEIKRPIGLRVLAMDDFQWWVVLPG